MTPDLVIFADTGGEKPGTYDYLNRVSRQERPDRTKHAWPGAWQNTIFRNESSFLMFGGER